MSVGKVRNLDVWVFAFIASIALHVVVLGVVIGLRGCGGAAPAVPPVPQTDGRATDVASERDPGAAAPEPRVEDAQPLVAPKKPEVRKPEPAKRPVARGERGAAEVPGDGWKSYKVKPGESLTKIARACGCTVHELARANGLSPTANLKVGQMIKVRETAAAEAERP